MPLQRHVDGKASRVYHWYEDGIGAPELQETLRIDSSPELPSVHDSRVRAPRSGRSVYDHTHPYA